MAGGLVVGGVFGSASRHFTEPCVPILILGSLRSVAMCQKATHAPQQNDAHVNSFDHLIGAAEQREGNGETKRLCDFEVDDQLNFHGLLDRQTGGIGSVENLAGIDAGLAICIGKTGSVAHQAAGRGELTQRVNCRQRVARRKFDELMWPGDEERIDVNAERADSLLNERGEGCLKVAIGAGLNDRQFSPKRIRCCLHVSRVGLGIRIDRIYEEAD
jgi:hypothetical protein